MECSIEIRDVTVVLGERVVLKSVSAMLEEKLVCLIGPNGAGKTTLLKTLAGVVRVASGVVRVCGLSPEDARSVVSFVPSSLYVEPFTRVVDVMRAYAYRASSVARFEEALEAVGLPKSTLWRRLGELSDGERRLALLAAALVRKPRVLLLDEPFSHLDLRNQVRVAKLLRLLAESSTLVLYTAHEPTHALVARELLVLKNGSLIAKGPSRLILRASFLREVYEVDFVETGGVPVVLMS
ncbi:MAG: ABC transporter ATP-binding protein [Acidilobaceae archaeon]